MTALHRHTARTARTAHDISLPASNCPHLLHLCCISGTAHRFFPAPFNPTPFSMPSLLAHFPDPAMSATLQPYSLSAQQQLKQRCRRITERAETAVCCCGHCLTSASQPSALPPTSPLPSAFLQLLLIVRHGESEYNKAISESRSFADPHIFDPPLTNKGIKQVRAGRGRRVQGASKGGTESSQGQGQYGREGRCFQLSLFVLPKLNTL